MDRGLDRVLDQLSDGALAHLSELVIKGISNNDGTSDAARLVAAMGETVLAAATIGDIAFMVLRVPRPLTHLKSAFLT